MTTLASTLPPPSPIRDARAPTRALWTGAAFRCTGATTPVRIAPSMALWGALAFGSACAPLASRAGPAGPGTIAMADGGDSVSALDGAAGDDEAFDRVARARARATRPRANVPRVAGLSCTIAFEDADVILAQVGDIVLTACDVALAERRNIREGLPLASRAQLLNELVRDVLFAQLAIERRVDQQPSVRRRVDDTLADGVVARAAFEAVRAALPDEAELRRYYDAHASEFVTAERAHLRELVVADEDAARAAIREAATRPFAELVRERTMTHAGRRDEGDLGLVPRGGNERVPRAIADAGFALAEPGMIHPEPIRVETTETYRVRRRQRTRQIVGWHVVQLIARLPEVRVPFEQAASRISFRLGYSRFQNARAAARTALLDRLRAEHPAVIETRTLRSVRVAGRAPR